MDSHIQITVIVCTYNEDIYLKECLESVSFAGEIIVCDMGSTDNTRTIAEQCGAKIIEIPKAEFVEKARAAAVSYATSPWILFMDPDFIYPSNKHSIIESELLRDPSLTCVKMLYKNYYIGQPVNSGLWRMVHRYPILFKKDSMELRPILHNGWNLKQGNTFEPDRSIYLQHMWISSEQQFYAKHWRYIQNEGVRRITDNSKYSPLSFISYVSKQIKRGVIGLISSDKLAFDLLKKSIWYEYESAKQHLLDIITNRGIKLHTTSMENRLKLVVIYSYNPASRPSSLRQMEYSLTRLQDNPMVSKIVLNTSGESPIRSNKIEHTSFVNMEPSYFELCAISRSFTSEMVTVVLPSNSFFDETFTQDIGKFSENVINVINVNRIPKLNPLLPIKLCSIKKHSSPKSHRENTALVFRGALKSNNDVNDLCATPIESDQFSKAGYTIVPRGEIVSIYQYYP